LKAPRRTLLRTSVVIALSGVAGARGCTGAMKAAALERSAKATTSFIFASCFLSLGSMLAYCTVTEDCEMQRTAQQVDASVLRRQTRWIQN
jgi:hypothetical protein